GAGDVALAVGEDLLDVLPLLLLEGGRRQGLVEVADEGGALAALEGGEDLVHVGGLLDVVGGAEADGVDGGGDGAVAGEDDDLGAGVGGLGRPGGREAGVVGHLEVDDGHRGGLLAGEGEGGVVAAGGAHLVASAAEGSGEAVAEGGVVVDDEEGGGGGPVGGAHGWLAVLARGARRVTWVPRPSADSMSRVPPRDSMMVRVRKR